MAIFDQAHLKVIEPTIHVPEFVPSCKKSVYSIYSFLKKSNLESHEQTAKPILDHAHRKKFSSAFNFLWICINMQKNQFFPSVHLSDTVNYRVPSPDWPHPFLTIPTQKSIYQLLTFCESVSTWKKISLPYLFILQIQSVLESHHQTGHTYFWPCQFQRFSITF